MPHIRKAVFEEDKHEVWEIFSKVIQLGDTYVFEPDTPKEKLEGYWFASYMDSFVLVDEYGVVLATYIIKPNQIGLGDHIANASYMVHPDHQGKGFGAMLCEHSISFATEKGFKGIQFNIVVSTNKPAVHLWEKFGFNIIGTTPGGFRHRKLGRVDTYIMFKDISDNL
ncbi:GNAT family N-acetyltransferase [Algoriphagus machipongonensis]|uniref:Acetyltransferase, GNAT family n=1 Tax=Algoriphagus machipongonensis TaxID=388413 RepID=A3I0B2_9BACT|nr:GNAT family N-acetyltransferase [Algoriphagus machipongonensis]EAZ79908.1 acetyltransferase, GNAT family [Algoriphagus machipongonensis]